ncbi:phosphotransferase [Nocardia brasiliensis]|uniref:class III lanthionine synthetase LanKC N-terminal domain-containing protein n=1 Tax=Nocardia brasiliensis TaxID=37326 RepID=UPI0024559E0F|nr:phosphotransferase [Nocardia brasiliensis]
MLYEKYCVRDREFFAVRAVQVNADDLLISRSFPGYQQAPASYWTHWTPIDSVPLQIQGWKIHVSASYGSEREVASTVAEFCVERSLHFKAATAVSWYRAMNSKNASRSSSGKLITIYPPTELLEEVLRDLKIRTQSFDGPDVLTDLRVSDGPIHLRYGAFKRMEKDGMLCIVGPDGALQEDLRQPWFSPPAWVDVPEFITNSVPTQTQTLAPFRVERAIKQSNAGGVYAGIMIDTARKIVLKEGRAHAGLTADGRDGYQRIRHETMALQQIADIGVGPEVLWHGDVAGRYFLAVADVGETTLQSWIVSNIPLYSTDHGVWNRYALQCKLIVDNLLVCVAALRLRGVVHADLHPRNVIIDAESFETTLIDFETARVAPNDMMTGVNAPGYRPPRSLPKEREDEYAVAQIITYMLTARTEHADITPNRDNWAVPALLEQLGDIHGRLLEAVTDLVAVRATLVDSMQAGSEWRPNPVEPPENFIGALSQDLPATMAAAVARFGRQPVHFDALEDDLHGIAFGSPGNCLALLGSGCPVGAATLLADLENTRRVGLFDGVCGTVYALVASGDVGAALQVLRGTRLFEKAHGWRIFDGKPGLLLAALRMSAHPDVMALLVPDIERELEQLARRYLSDRNFLDTKHTAKTNRTIDQNSGLLFGDLGLAWVFADAFQYYGRPSYLNAMNEAMVRELERYSVDAEGRLQFKQESRLLPYLATGSAGFGVVLSNISSELVTPSVTEHIDSLIAAASPVFSVNCGLFNGYAGLVYGSNGLRSFSKLPKIDATELNQMVRGMAVRTSFDTWAIPGDLNLRITTDFATGSSGVVHAANLMARNDYGLLPRL